VIFHVDLRQLFFCSIWKYQTNSGTKRTVRGDGAVKHKDKVALVTGAAQGLGFACAERLHAEGAKVVLVDVQAERVTAQAERLGDFATCWIGDLAQISAAMAADIVGTAVKRFGRLDILINNAGIIHLSEFVDFPEDAFDRVQRVNLKAPFLIGQAAAKAMIAQGQGGAIINMSSINAVLANPTSVAYAVAKGGLKQLTAVMAVALIPYGIRVNAIGPGTILTEMVKESVMASEAQRRTILSRTPIGRCGEPAEVASVASFLASEDASYIVGQTIYPDGGRLILNYTVPVKE
jgi:NAD(P)-dependent dehydrogenase (short-subunit alcohol dehydrogenase family)